MTDIHYLYVYDPNAARFIAGPFQCANVAHCVLRERQLMAGAAANEPWMVIEISPDEARKRIVMKSKATTAREAKP